MKYSITLVFYFLSLIIIFPQSIDVDLQNKIKIDSIYISGNENTKDFIILRELNFTNGDYVDSLQLNYNKERVFSLGLFSNVDFLIEKDSTKTLLNIKVFESWYIYPLPIIHTNGHSFDKLSYGLRLIYKNFRGRNETISLRFALGYNKYFLLNYLNPYFFNENLKFLLTYLNSEVTNKSLKYKEHLSQNFNYKANILGLSLGKRLDQYNDIFLSLKYSHLKSLVYYDNFMASNTMIDEYFSAGLSYVYDTRDLIQQPTRGIYFYSDFLNNGFGIKNINFNSITFDYRNYIELVNKLIFKYQLYTRNTFGNLVPIHYKSYLGHNYYIRGHKNEVLEANNLLLVNAELNYHLIKEMYLKFKLPLLPERLTSFRIGLILRSFIDSGKVYNNFSEIFNENNLQYGYGIGINILFLPQNSLNIDYGINRYGKGEFIIATGISF